MVLCLFFKPLSVIQVIHNKLFISEMYTCVGFASNYSRKIIEDENQKGKNIKIFLNVVNCDDDSTSHSNKN